MIKAYKAGVPGNGQPFPDGSMIVKLQWKPKKSTEAPFRRGCARRLHPGFRHGKGQQEISEKRRMGIRGVQLRSRIGQVHGRSQKPLRLRKRVPYGREGEGLHLPPVPEALNRACPDSKKDVPVRVVIFDVDFGLLREVQPIARQCCCLKEFGPARFEPQSVGAELWRASDAAMKISG